MRVIRGWRNLTVISAWEQWWQGTIRGLWGDASQTFQQQLPWCY